ncbi:MAG: type II CRISPR RNA-guided endonuclease Cas9, partial [Ignavibacteria bacterium]
MKKILGLDIGTNSIGWALIDYDFDNKTGKINALGSRIIPLEADKLKDFQQGRSASLAAERRMARQARRLKYRYKLRRERLIKVFKILGWFPQNFPEKFEEDDHFNINDFVPFSDQTIQEAKKLFNVVNLPNDWAIYYLRDKALREQVSLQELARIIYHFNQRRGFKSSRIENKSTDIVEQEVFPKTETFYEFLKITSIKETNEKRKSNQIFIVEGKTKGNVTYTGTLSRKIKPDWLNQEIELEITKTTKKDGTVSFTFKEPDRSNWEERKLALEKDIKLSGLSVGQYHLKKLLEDRNYRIKEQIVDRKFYQEELVAIWKSQERFYPELKNNPKIEEIAKTLYQHNEQKQKELQKLSLLEIIKDDIIYYQRPLKSQKKLIGECHFEKKNFIDQYGRQPGYKVAPKSSPIFQEYRIWQTINNLRIFKRKEMQPDDKVKFDVEKTEELLNIKNKEKLFELFDSKDDVKIDEILKALDLSPDEYRINFPQERELKGNETKAAFRRVFKRHNFIEEGEKILGNRESFFNLWHLTYSVIDENQLAKSLIKKFNFSEELAIHISKMPPFKKEYAAYSSKALKKLVPLMRCGKYWNEEEIDPSTKQRIEKIINGSLKSSFPEEIINKLYSGSYKSISNFQGLPVYLACYVVYGKHSERELYEKFDHPDEIDHLKLLPTNSLRNPVVEKVIRETLLVVK